MSYSGLTWTFLPITAETSLPRSHRYRSIQCTPRLYIGPPPLFFRWSIQDA